MSPTIFQDLSRITSLQWTAFRCRVPQLCKLLLSFQTCDNSDVGMCVRTALAFQQGHEGQTMAPLTRFWPPPAQHQLTWKKQPSKKCCWLLTGMPVCCCWVEFEPCIDYPNGAEQCCCLLRITFGSSVWRIAHSYKKHKQQGCYLFCKGKHLCMFMQILHILHSEKLPNPKGSLW